MPELVKDKVYVVINAINFNELTTRTDSFAYTVFNRFTHWYYFEESDIFAPSKFIGYENTTLENYRRETGRHGGKTEKLLTHWFEQLDRDSSYFAELSTKLFHYAEKLGKKVKKNYHIHIEKPGPILDRSELEEVTDKVRERIRKNPDLRPPSGVIRPKPKKQTTIQYPRDSRIRAWVLERAGDTCESCFNKAPFVNENGRPFLETHHITPLAQGGPDTLENTVALCPNCHRHLHFGKDREHLKLKLLKYVKTRTFNSSRMPWRRSI